MSAREELAGLLARTMPGWNEDTSEPDITDSRLRQSAEAHWERVNKECLRQGREYADAVLDWLAAHDAEVKEEAANAAIAKHAQMIMDTQRQVVVDAIVDAEMRGYTRQIDERLEAALRAKAVQP